MGTGIWEPVTEPVLMLSKLSVLSPLKLARPADLLLSKCTTPKSSSLCHLVSRSPRDPFSRPRDPTHISFRLLLLVKKNKTPHMGEKKKKKKKKPQHGGKKKKKKKKKKK